jgi:UDP-N-acetylglucosamine acyltransferase
MSTIHPTASIEQGAELGVDVEVGPFAVIHAHTRVGDRCTIGSHSVILPWVTLGSECRLHAHVVIGDLPQDLAFVDGESTLKIGDRCVMREFFTAHRGTKEGSETRIGSDCYFMNCSHIGHNCRVENRVILANSALLAGYVDVGEGVFLSGNTSVHQFTRLGRLSMMGGQSAVSQDVPPFCTTEPTAPNTILGLNVVGMRRSGMDPETRKAVKSAFRLLYQSELTPSQATEKIREQFQSGPALEMADFVDAAKKGICTTSRQ